VDISLAGWCKEQPIGEKNKKMEINKKVEKNKLKVELFSRLWALRVEHSVQIGLVGEKFDLKYLSCTYLLGLGIN